MSIIDFISKNAATLTVVVLLAALIILAVLAIIKKRKGGLSCSSCGGCALSGTCEKRLSKSKKR